MSVLVYVNRKAKNYGRKKKVYPFQFGQGPVLTNGSRVYFKGRKLWRQTMRKPPRYPIKGPSPVTFVQYKKPPRPKIRRWRSNIRTRAKYRYVIPGAIVQNTAKRSTVRLGIFIGAT